MPGQHELTVFFFFAKSSADYITLKTRIQEGLAANRLLSQNGCNPGETQNRCTSLSRRNHLSVDKQPQWGRVLPLKTLSGVLEKELLMIPIAKETTSLFVPYSGVFLNLIPLTLEDIWMIVLQVSAKICVANGAWSPSICEHQEVQMCQPTMLPMISQIGCWVIAPASRLCQLPREALHVCPGTLSNEENWILPWKLIG